MSSKKGAEGMEPTSKNYVNLCDSCSNEFAECKARSLQFGDGEGDYNVITCELYSPLTNRKSMGWDS